MSASTIIWLALVQKGAPVLFARGLGKIQYLSVELVKEPGYYFLPTRGGGVFGPFEDLEKAKNFANEYKMRGQWR